MAGLLPSKSNELVENSDINVTPFIDVMLVLLIIFMVVAPLSTVSMDIKLPTSNADAMKPQSEPLIITLESDLALSIAGEAIAEQQLTDKLIAVTQNDFNQTLYVQADKSVDYGDLMHLLNALSASGFANVALVGLESAE